MRKRAQPPTYSSDEVPPALRVGPCIEVWADAPADYSGLPGYPVSAHRNYSRTRSAWLESQGVPRVEHIQVLPLRGAPWSYRYLTETGRSDRAKERLAEAGVTERDLPALREMALELLKLPGARPARFPNRAVT